MKRPEFCTCTREVQCDLCCGVYDDDVGDEETEDEDCTDLESRLEAAFRAADSDGIAAGDAYEARLDRLGEGGRV